MDELEFNGKVSAQKLSSVEEDNRAAQTQYRQDVMANALRRITTKKPKVEELVKRFNRLLREQKEFIDWLLYINAKSFKAAIYFDLALGSPLLTTLP